MPRYIDADKLVAWCTETAKVQSTTEGKAYVDAFLTAVFSCTTADVVPKSEYDAVVSAVDNSTKEFLKLHDKYQEAKREIENLKVLLEMKDVSYAGLKELYDTDTTALIEAREKTEVEVAREILEEIEENILGGHFLKSYEWNEEAYSELKKKYTEENV